MRVSVNKTDPGYTQAAYGYEVYLDGEYLNNCHTADEELGHAYVYTGDIDDTYDLTSICLIGDVKIKTNLNTGDRL